MVWGEGAGEGLQKQSAKAVSAMDGRLPSGTGRMEPMRKLRLDGAEVSKGTSSNSKKAPLMWSAFLLFAYFCRWPQVFIIATLAEPSATAVIAHALAPDISML